MLRVLLPLRHSAGITGALLLSAALASFGCGDDDSGRPPDDAGLSADARVDAPPSALDSGAADSGAADSGAADAGSGSFADIVTQAMFDEFFLHRGNDACDGNVFTYEALLEAAATFPSFCAEGSVDVRRREAAAFLANASHETTGGWATAPDGPYAWGLCFKEEVGCGDGGCAAYCAPSEMWSCAPGRSYHGRGAMQLSWNYNYGQAGSALGLDLLNEPDLVASDGVVAFRTAIWFWMTAQAPKPSCHDVMVGHWTPSEADLSANRQPGFGMTVNIINGGLECNIGPDSRVDDRIGFYRRYAELMGVDPGEFLDCATMTSY